MSQLRKMDFELSAWRAQYTVAAETTQAPWLASRFRSRANELTQMEIAIAELRQRLVDFPRLS